MSRNGGDSDTKSTTDQDLNVSYIRFDGHSTLSACSSIVLSSCSDDEENDKNSSIPPLRWKRQKILNNDYHTPERLPSGKDAVNHLHTDRNLAMAVKENIAATFDDERRPIPPRRLPPIPEDKLHRRNPHTVRQEIKMFDGLIPETSLADVHLNEMPGVHNTEQWKRIAGRAVHPSPPLSRQYYQTVISTLELQNGQVPQPLGSYRRPGRSENEQDSPTVTTSRWRAPRRRIFFGSSVAVVIVAIVVAVVLAVTLIQKASPTASDYYSGSISVNAKFDQVLFNPSSMLSRSYKREFCTLIGTTLVDAQTKYALFYSTCSVTGFRNGSIIADFVLGFTRSQNVTRLNFFLNRTLINQQLFGGTIQSIAFNLTISNPNSTNDYDNGDDGDDGDDDDDKSNSEKDVMMEQSLTNEQQEPTRTTYTTVTYTKLDTGLSITISETITITNNNNTNINLDNLPINNKKYDLILVPTTDNTKTIAVPTVDIHDKSLLPPLPVTTTTTTVTKNIETKSPSQHNLPRPIKPIDDPNFAYIDESSDDHTFSSGDVSSTLEDITTRDSTTSNSTISLNDETLKNSTSTLVRNTTIPTNEPTVRPTNPTQSTSKTKNDSAEEDKGPGSQRPKPNIIRRRRMVAPKNQRRLLQYELMPTGKVYYVDRTFYNEHKTSKDDNEDDSSVILSTILSRSSSLDTLSEKRHRYHQQNRKHYHDLTLKKSEQKLSVGGRLASNNNLPISSPFKPIHLNKKKRYSSFEPTPESLDRVFDVLIAADKRREKHEFWKEKFDHHPTTSRAPIGTGRAQDTTNSNTIPFLRSKQTQVISNSALSNTDQRSQSYTNKHNSLPEAQNRQSNCLLEDCLRRRTLLLKQQPPPPPSQLQRNYSPNTIYSTNYPKQQLLLTSKPPLPTTTNQQPVRILPLSNGRIGRAPQARQTSDELSSISDVWAARSSLEEESHHNKKSSNHTRFQSTVPRSRINERKNLVNNKRASSVEQQKPNRIPNKNVSTTKNKFFDLFKFTR